MEDLPRKLEQKLSKRVEEDALRTLSVVEAKIDFTSNDYLGFARNEALYRETLQLVEKNRYFHNGATGSRLLSGNNEVFETTEKMLCDYYNSKAALLFNSGYDANLGLFASVPQRGDLILYDEYVHASIRDGIGGSNARHLKFKHNDLQDLKRILVNHRNKGNNHKDDVVYVVTESVFSMDGDSPDLSSLADLCMEENCCLIVDEAHAVGLFGQRGTGLVEELGLTDKIFARIVTFGKALGSHGAAVLGSVSLRDYLVNFARSFIYTTALSPHSVCAILAGHKLLSSTEGRQARQELRSRIDFFKSKLSENGLKDSFIPSNSAIHSCVLPGNLNVKRASGFLIESDFDVRPILSPTVPAGQERLRLCLHSYNTEDDICSVLEQLALSLDIQ